jgi:hypothetical protein
LAQPPYFSQCAGASAIKIANLALLIHFFFKAKSKAKATSSSV